MIYILLAILTSAILVNIMRSFPKYNIDVFQAILFNYAACLLTSWAVSGKFPLRSEVFAQPWLKWALLLGFFFIIGFNLIGICVQKVGVSLTSILQKMTMLVTVLVAIFFFKDSLNAYKILGVILAIVSIFLTNKQDESNTLTKISYTVPILTFLTSSVCDVGVYLINKTVVGINTADPDMVAMIFAGAGAMGLIYFFYLLLMKKTVFHFRNIIAGFVLGVPNFFSIYFLLAALNQGEGSVIAPIVNVGIIITATIMGWIIFKEKLNTRQSIGVGIAVIAILLIMKGSI
jgi:drug/metabolite transporter (DMT)-like permease